MVENRIMETITQNNRNTVKRLMVSLYKTYIKLPVIHSSSLSNRDYKSSIGKLFFSQEIFIIRNLFPVFFLKCCLLSIPLFSQAPSLINFSCILDSDPSDTCEH